MAETLAPPYAGEPAVEAKEVAVKPAAKASAKALPYLNSYTAGVILGLVLLAAFVFTGRGLGASGAATRITAHGLQKVEAAVRGGTAAERDTWAHRSAYLGQYVAEGTDAYDDFLVYMFLGIIIGGFASGVVSRRFSFETVMGPHTNVKRRLAIALLGGVVSAFGARLARGCTSGQALTGGATLAVGSWIFMLAVFAGGYALAYFFRKEWL